MTGPGKGDDVDPIGQTVTPLTVTAGSRGLEPAPPSLATGAAVGRYRIDGVLGRGGMGIVYRAHDPDLDRPVAIKVLRPELREARKRLLKEGQAVAKLRHPNVITVHDVGVHAGDLFIAMELVDGGTLRHWLTDKPRTVAEILATFVEAGRGLAAAHAAGLVHRDFKPDNVLVGRDGRIVVGDFGLAQDGPGMDPVTALPTGAVDVTMTAGIAGTPAYMAPEQFRGELADARSDQFAFCVTLWEALYGGRPFTPADPTSIDSLAEAVEAGELRDPRDRRRVPARIHAALRRGLARSPAARFASIEELLATLRPRTSRRIVWLAAAAVIVAGGCIAAIVGRPSTSLVAGDPLVCDGGPSADAWTDANRRELLTEVSGARQARWLDTYRLAIEVSHRSRCVADSIRAIDPASDPDLACIDGAADDLRAAAGRPVAMRNAWPLLTSLRACAGREPPAIETLAVQTPRNESYFLSPDGTRLMVRHEGQRPSIRNARSGAEITRLADGAPLRWLDDERVAVAADGAVVVCDAKTGEPSRTIAVRGRVADVTTDLSQAVVHVDGMAWLISLIDPADPGTAVVPGEVGQVAHFSPTGRAIGILTGTAERALLLRDLSSGRESSVPLPLAGPFGELQFGWIDDTRLVVSGALPGSTMGWLWALHLTTTGDLLAVDPLLSAGDTGSFWLEDVHRDRILVSHLMVARQMELRTGDRVEPAPSTLAAARAEWAASDGSWILVRSGKRWLNVRPSDWTITPIDLGRGAAREIAEAQGDGDRMVGIVLEGGEARYFELEAGEMVTRALPPELRESPRVRCRASRCIVYAADEHAIHVYRVVVDRFERVGHLEPAGGLPRKQVNDLDISIDGQRIVVTTRARRVVMFDAAGKAIDLPDPSCPVPQSVRFSPDDRTVLYSCVGSEFSLRRVDLTTGKTSALLSTSASWISGLEVLPGERILLTTQSHTGTLELVDLASP